MANLNRDEEASDAFRRSVAYELRGEKPLLDLGVCYFRLGRMEDALDALRAARDVHPTNAQAWKWEGYVLARLQKTTEACACLERSLTLDAEAPDRVETFTNLGVYYGKLRHHESAVRAFDRAHEADQKYAFAWNARGVALGEDFGDGQRPVRAKSVQ